MLAKNEIKKAIVQRLCRLSTLRKFGPPPHILRRSTIHYSAHIICFYKKVRKNVEKKECPASTEEKIIKKEGKKKYF